MAKAAPPLPSGGSVQWRKLDLGAPVMIQSGQGWGQAGQRPGKAKRVPVPGRERFPEEEQPNCHWENDEQLARHGGQGLVFKADGTAGTMPGKQESESIANGKKNYREWSRWER